MSNKESAPRRSGIARLILHENDYSSCTATTAMAAGDVDTQAFKMQKLGLRWGTAYPSYIVVQLELQFVYGAISMPTSLREFNSPFKQS